MRARASHGGQTYDEGGCAHGRTGVGTDLQQPANVRLVGRDELEALGEAR